MNEVAKKLFCIVIRNGVEIWADEDFIQRLTERLQKVSGHTFIPFEGRLLNTADISGIFTAEDMADMARRKRGEWLCKWNEWHTKRQDCDCWDAHKYD